VSGDFDTHFVKNFYQPEILNQRNEEEALIAAALAIKVNQEQKQVMQNAMKKSNERWKRRY
jgi:propionyl-CoA carboxylase alpha chain